MGNWNSNRWTQYKRRDTVDRALMLGMPFFAGKGLTDQSHQFWDYTWPNLPNYRMEIAVCPCDSAGLLLQIMVLHTSKRTISINQEIVLHSTTLPGGGLRKWAECPMVVKMEGDHPVLCSRRCSVLYAPYKANEYLQFGCRECHELTYRSSQSHSKRHVLAKRDPLAFLEAELARLQSAGIDVKQEMDCLQTAVVLRGMSKGGFSKDG